MTNSLPSLTVPCFQSAGPLQVWVNTTAIATSTYTLQFLGFTRNGAEIQEQAYMSELKSDYGGGEQGQPDEYQFLAEAHSISLEMARWNSTVLAALARRMQVAASARTPGMMVGCLGGQFQCLLLAANFARLYTRVFIPEPITMAPIGTPAIMPRLTLMGLGDSSNTDYLPWKATGWTVAGSTVTIP